MSPDLWLMALVVAVNALFFHALPRLSRPDILFSVTVPGAFAASGEAAAVVRRYRTIVWLSTLVCAGVMLALPPRDARAAVVGLHIAVIFGAWAWANRRVRPHAAPAPAVRVAALAPRDIHLPGGALFAAGPLLMLAAAALFLWQNGVSGRYPALAIGAFVTSTMLAMAWTIVARTRQIAIDGAPATGERTFKRLSALHLLCSAYATAGMSAAVAVGAAISGADPSTARGAGRLPPFILVLLGVAVALSFGFMLAMIWLGQGGQRAIAPNARGGIHGDGTPDAGWIGGFVYYNPGDPALLVERRMGIGWTLNMANRWSWLIVGAVALAIVISKVLR